MAQNQLKKKFRLGEFIAEKFITLIAFFSLAMITLIFIFVFRETLPIFYTKTETKIATEQIEKHRR